MTSESKEQSLAPAELTGNDRQPELQGNETNPPSRPARARPSSQEPGPPELAYIPAEGSVVEQRKLSEPDDTSRSGGPSEAEAAAALRVSALPPRTRVASTSGLRIIYLPPSCLLNVESLQGPVRGAPL